MLTKAPTPIALMRAELPTEPQVRAAVTALLRQAATGGTRPTATALAHRAGISRPQLYRHFRPLIDGLLLAASTLWETSPPQRNDPTQELQDKLARLRRQCDEQERYLQLYEEIIRQLTVDNTRLRQQLEQHLGVAGLRTRQHS